MSTLLKSINSSDTTLSTTFDALFPNDNGVIVIGTEIITYVSNYMGTLYGCVRGAQSTIAASHDAGASVSILDFYDAAGTIDSGITQLTGDVTAGPGSASQAATLANTAVTPGSFTNTSLTVDSKGRLTAASSGTAPVTSVSGTAPISSSGGATPAISLDDTAVTPGSYTSADITVDAQGRITSAANGSGGSGATTELDNLTTTAINASLLFDADNSYDLGDSTNSIKDIYLDGSLLFNNDPAVHFRYNSGTSIFEIGRGSDPVTLAGDGQFVIQNDSAAPNASITLNSNGDTTISGGGNDVVTLNSGSLSPNTDFGVDLGGTSNRWSGFFSSQVFIYNDLRIEEGTNKSSGVATLVGGTVTVSTTKVRTDSRIQLTAQNLGTIITPVALAISARTDGTDFTILSADPTDTSDIAWVIINPNV